MLYQDWKAQALGKHLDVDGAFGAQCVDVYLDYIQTVIGVHDWASVSGYGNAVDMYDTVNTQYFDKLTGIIPRQGDVVIFNATTTNSAGHIAIVDSADTNFMQCIEQDGFNPTGVCYAKQRSYINVKGFLRPKGLNMNENIITEKSQNALRIVHSEIGGWDFDKTHKGEYDKLFLDAWRGKTYDYFLNDQWLAGSGFRAKRIQAMAEYDGLKQQVASLTQSSVEKDAQIKALQAQLAIQSQDTQLLNSMGELFKKLIVRFGLKG